jgi:uncharacterized protein YwgA
MKVMDRYQLTKLVEWADHLKSRKRMQKVVYLLQCAGAPLEADYELHYYGPYSFDVAQLTNELVQIGVLVEDTDATGSGKQYNYRIAPERLPTIRNYEETPAGIDAHREILPFEALAKRLFDKSIAELEYAATIAYFYNLRGDWDDSLTKACRFKNLAPESVVAQNALVLAQQMFA